MENGNTKLKDAKPLAAAMIILIGVVGRFVLINYVGIPNFEIITALALISGIYLGGVYTILVPLSIIFLSDLAIGNNYIFIFTWTAFMFIGLFGYLYGKLRITKNNFSKRLLEVMGLSIGSSMFFYLYTNFGWWLMSGMYPHTIEGLVQCYIVAIPFFKNNLIGNLIFVPTAIYTASRAIHYFENKGYVVGKYYYNRN